jgi:hypothetical protein
MVCLHWGCTHYTGQQQRGWFGHPPALKFQKTEGASFSTARENKGAAAPTIGENKGAPRPYHRRKQGSFPSSIPYEEADNQPIRPGPSEALFDLTGSEQFVDHPVFALNRRKQQ